MKDRKNQYSIGEVAALLNISPQTLRFYDKSGVVVPDFIDQKTGYRYYSYDQISYISRVRYLQQFGFSLEEIRNALASNDIRQFRSFLQRRREDLRAKAEHLTGLLEDLDWYIGYYSYLESHNFNGFPYYQQEPERYLLARAPPSGRRYLWNRRKTPDKVAAESPVLSGPLFAGAWIHSGFFCITVRQNCTDAFLCLSPAAAAAKPSESDDHSGCPVSLCTVQNFGRTI